ncbi:MAG: type II toxin-antitoxin system HicB family antitoxin [Cyanothece sp. SIO2G6]|nr:type II toxin-antitoxin system HicB family antitoxin [Cyanothece sp. SIO2G6]
MKENEFYVVIEKDEDGLYVGEVPQLSACYSQGETIDELMANMREVVEMCLEELEDNRPSTEFIGVQRLVL